MPKRESVSAQSLLRFRRLLIIPVQLALVVVSNRLALDLRFDNAVPQWALASWWQMLPWLVAIRAITFIPFRLYEGFWRYTSIYDLRALVGGVSISSFIFLLVAASPLGPAGYPRSIVIIDAVLLTLFLGGIRLARRVFADVSRIQSGKRVLIFGAGDAGELIVRDMKSDRRYGYQPIGFIDDDVRKKGLRIHGVPVLGTRHQLSDILDRWQADEILLAMPNVEPSVVREIVRALEAFDIPIKTLPNLRDIIDGKVEVAQIRSLAVEDLLARAPIGLDRKPVDQLIAGRRVMVTGAGGSIGSELCRQIVTLRPASLVMFERYENSLHAIRMELEDSKLGAGLHAVIGDVTDGSRLEEVMRMFRPEIVFHAAAHKHVPLMEENPCEAIKNNVRGTRMLAHAADAFAVDRFVMISTDKAVNPTSVMGASKRVAEMVIQAQAAGSGTSFSIVRFGNVLGSNGSVIPRFVDQIRRGGPLTITHPDMRRFFMLIPEAVQLVLHAASQAVSGATYVLEMGEQVKLVDMARDLIRLSGLVPDEDIKIEFIGLRPGEKLYEELVGPDEQVGPSRVEKILRVTSTRPIAPAFIADVHALESAAAGGETGTVRTMLRQLASGNAAPEPAALTIPSAAPALSFARAVHAAGEQRCPKCATGRIHRSRARSIAEKVRKEFTAQRLFRCSECGWRGWAAPLAFAQHKTIDQPPAPDLTSLDEHIAPIPPDARLQFSPRNLN